MLSVTCRGSPYEIGFQHGSVARDAVAGSLAFTIDLIQENAKKELPEIQQFVARFEPIIKRKWPRYYEEMQGLAEGAGCNLLDIIMLNTRTELAFGLAPKSEKDGCTSLYCKVPNGALQGQNWDFLLAPKENLIQVTIYQPAFPTIKMITEAGIIGKIGINSAGVGVCYNALYISGMSISGLSSHLAMRMALESVSPAEAYKKIETQGGMAASAFILVGNKKCAYGIEFSYKDIRRQFQDDKGNLLHTNHCLLQHEPGVKERDVIPDSRTRSQRMGELVEKFSGSEEEFSKLWEDEYDYPTAICRDYEEGKSRGATLFNIVMDLKRKRAVVKLGRPVNPDETFVMDFEDEDAQTEQHVVL